MLKDKSLIEDIAAVCASAAGNAMSLSGEMGTTLKQQRELLIKRFDLVTREEYEVLFTLASEAKAAQEVLAQRVAVLEEALATKKKKKS